MYVSSLFLVVHFSCLFLVYVRFSSVCASLFVTFIYHIVINILGVYVDYMCSCYFVLSYEVCQFMYNYMHIYIYIYTYTYTYMYIYIYIYIHTSLSLSIYIYMMCVYIYIYIYTYRRMHSEPCRTPRARRCSSAGPRPHTVNFQTDNSSGYYFFSCYLFAIACSLGAAGLPGGSVWLFSYYGQFSN